MMGLAWAGLGWVGGDKARRCEDMCVKAYGQRGEGGEGRLG